MRNVWLWPAITVLLSMAQLLVSDCRQWSVIGAQQRMPCAAHAQKDITEAPRKYDFDNSAIIIRALGLRQPKVRLGPKMGPQESA